MLLGRPLRLCFPPALGLDSKRVCKTGNLTDKGKGRGGAGKYPVPIRILGKHTAKTGREKKWKERKKNKLWSERGKPRLRPRDDDRSPVHSMQPAGIFGTSQPTLNPGRSWDASILLALPQSYTTKSHGPSCLGCSSGKPVPAPRANSLGTGPKAESGEKEGAPENCLFPASRWDCGQETPLPSWAPG